MRFLCKFKKHRWLFVFNLTDVTGGRAVYQCRRCKKITIDCSVDTMKDHRMKLVDGEIEYELYH